MAKLTPLNKTCRDLNGVLEILVSTSTATYYWSFILWKWSDFCYICKNSKPELTTFLLSGNFSAIFSWNLSYILKTNLSSTPTFYKKIISVPIQQKTSKIIFAEPSKTNFQRQLSLVYRGTYTAISKTWLLKMPVQLLAKINPKFVGTAAFFLESWQVPRICLWAGLGLAIPWQGWTAWCFLPFLWALHKWRCCACPARL